MIKIGCHLSSAKGYANMAKDAVKINANTLQFFTRNPRGGRARAIDEKDIKAFHQIAEENHIHKIVAHAPYTLNPCSASEKTRAFAYTVVEDDLRRMEYFPGNYYNMHPGSHGGQGTERGIALIVSLLNDLIKPEQSTIVLLETMAGKGNEVGGNFEELAEIIEGVELKDKIGVCLDTCHVHDAGYAIAENLNQVVDEFDRIIGMDKLYALHINDSMNPVGAKKDRHAKIGEGHIGLDGILKVITHPRLMELPFILETPNELEGYGKEIALLRQR